MNFGSKNVIASALIVLAPLVAQAQEPVSLILNWTAGADHAPLYYAFSQGW
ncbi:MAG: hypothetical protein ABJH07_23030 [Sedimentitalea sp.]|uniref:hypothetical protein n=1 Tax=Sedimentitalea sp. TaxID=2048915 RepID=UPI003264869D